MKSIECRIDEFKGSLVHGGIREASIGLRLDGVVARNCLKGVVLDNFPTPDAGLYISRAHDIVLVASLGRVLVPRAMDLMNDILQRTHGVQVRGTSELDVDPRGYLSRTDLSGYVFYAPKVR